MNTLASRHAWQRTIGTFAEWRHDLSQRLRNALQALTASPQAVTRVHGVGSVHYVSSCALPTPWATFQLHGFIEPASGKEHLALSLGAFDDGAPVLARVHSECLSGDALFSQRCDCGAQLQSALQKIAAEGRGLVLYLRQEGRGIGLLNKIRAYQLQDGGADTVQANHALGFAADARDYAVCAPMLAHLGVSRVRLLTNNPRKLAALQALGIDVTVREALQAGENPLNRRYLDTKAQKLGHLLR